MTDFNSDILDEFDSDNVVYEQADKALRFVNFFVDRILSQLLMLIPYYFFEMFNSNSDIISPIDGRELLIFYFFAFLIPFLYYALCEHYLDGRTLAKFITKTKVVKPDGSKPTFMNILGRTLARYIPFEPFSFFGSSLQGWHDSISDTMVIRY